MRPSQAMGLFLRTWRSEWAGLSRAQLAIALSSQLSGRKGVTADVLRQWEAGQPPGDLEELDALCRVMRRHAVSEPEVNQFRDAVFAACVDRHYDGLFPGEDFAYRPDCHAVAEAAHWATTGGGMARSVVTLLAWVAELRNARLEANGPAPLGSLEYHQDAALAWTEWTLGVEHFVRGRFALAEEWGSRSAFDVEHRLRGRLAGPHTAARLATCAAIYGTAGDISRPRIETLLSLADRDEAAGEPVGAACTRCDAVCYCISLDDAESEPLGRSMAASALRVLEDYGDPWLIGLAHRLLHRLAVQRRDFAAAEEEFSVFSDARLSRDDRSATPYLMGIMLRAEGRPGAAAEQFVVGEQAAKELGHQYYEWECAHLRAECEREEHAARHSGKGRVIRTQHLP